MSETNNYEITITRENYSKMTSVLKVFENICTDCDIQNGLFRTKSNDRHGIISMDLENILGKNNLSFTLIKSKVNLLKSFELDENIQNDDKNIVITSNDSNYEVTDKLTKMVFRKPLQKYIDNKFITDEDFNNMIKIKEENLIFKYKCSSYLKKRINNICLGFQNDVIECKMIDGNITFKIDTVGHENSSTVAKDNDFQVNKVLNKEFKMGNLPFVLDIQSELELNCYSISSDTCICKFEQKFYDIPIVIYTLIKMTNI